MCRAAIVSVVGRVWVVKRKKYNCQQNKTAVNKAENRRKQQRFRDKMKNDPDKYEAWKREEHGRYFKRKAGGKIKMATDMSERVRRGQRKMRRRNTKVYIEYISAINTRNQ